MTPQDLKRALGPMPQVACDALSRTLDTLSDIPRRTRPRARLIPVIAILLAALMASAAYAATRPQVLRWLLGNAGSSDGLDALAAPVAARGEADGISVSITGVVCDGRQLAYAVEIENDQPSRPAAVAILGTWIGDADVQREDSSVVYADLRWTPGFHLDTLPVQRNPVLTGKTVSIVDPLPSGETTVCVRFCILRPSGPLAVVEALQEPDGTDEEIQLEFEDRLNTLLGFDGLVLADEAHMDANWWIDQGYTPIDLSGAVLAGDRFDEVMQETAVLTLSFPVDLSASARSYIADDSIAHEDYTVAAHAFTLSPLSTRLAFDLIPSENTQAAAARLVQAVGDIALCGADGQPIDFLSMDYLSLLSGQAIEQDGLWLCRYEIDMPGLCLLPDELLLCAASPLTPICRLRAAE